MRNLIFTISLLASTSSFAQFLVIGDISYAGKGCPTGSLDLSNILMEEEISIPFTDFIVNSGGQTGSRIDRKSCNLAIPVSAPTGFSVALVAAPEGYVELEQSGTLNLHQEVFFAGERGPVETRRFTGPVAESFYADDVGQPEQINWSPCGASTTMRVNLSATTLNSSFAVIETLRMKILWKSCGSF